MEKGRVEEKEKEKKCNNISNYLQFRPFFFSQYQLNYFFVISSHIPRSQLLPVLSLLGSLFPFNYLEEVMPLPDRHEN